MPRSVTEKKTDARAHEKGGRKDAADSAGAKGGRRRQDLENENNGERAPDPFPAQNGVDRGIPVSANLRVQHGKGPYDQTTQKHFQINRHRNPPDQVLTRAQESNKPGRDESAHDAEQ